MPGHTVGTYLVTCREPARRIHYLKVRLLHHTMNSPIIRTKLPNSLPVILATYPLAWLALLYLFVMRARLHLGHWPEPYQPHPKDLHVSPSRHLVRTHDAANHCLGDGRGLDCRAASCRLSSHLPSTHVAGRRLCAGRHPWAARPWRFFRMVCRLIMTPWPNKLPEPTWLKPFGYSCTTRRAAHAQRWAHQK
jgi:hypothetical protein